MVTSSALSISLFLLLQDDGANILTELQRQRETIERSRGTLQGADDNISKAGRGERGGGGEGRGVKQGAGGLD